MRDKDILLKRLHEDLIGPLQDDEKLISYPTDYYLTGILFPQKAEMNEEDADQLQTEGSGYQEEGDTSDDEVSLATIKKPASAGISFVVSRLDAPPEIRIEISAAKYEKVERDASELRSDDGQDQNAEAMIPKKEWQRIPVSKIINNIKLLNPTLDISPKDTGEKGLSVHIRRSKINENDYLVTVALINSNKNPEEYERDLSEERSFFQTNLIISCEEGTTFKARPLTANAIDEDTKVNALIYRNVKEYATGHTCSADWQIKNNTVVSVSMSWMPQSQVKAMSAEGVSEFKPLASAGLLSTKWLAESKGRELTKGLRELPDLYKKWCNSLYTEVNKLSEDVKKQALKHLDNADGVAQRMLSTVKLIESDEQVELAFRLANKAIMMQRQWAAPEDDKPLTWRPFQLGFILLTLESLANEKHQDRDVADLLWFPTGGGKTEAYLGLVAFNMFLRRLRFGDHGAGVTSFMRYTLRLLTVQQFQRATALICSCEYIRQVFNDRNTDANLGETPFSIGLWVGSDTTPNNNRDARAALNDSNAKSSPKQLNYCPKHKTKLLKWASGANGKQVEARCSDESCLWHSAPLPVWTVDEYVYHHLPSLIIGTIDKFAQVSRNKNTGKLFGRGTQYRAPELIIQDELHLISGPLGTMTGLYEIAIDKLCSNGASRPKIIASTATIRQASSQISALFDRKTCLFPPPMLDARNSGFAVEDETDPGRIYAGVTTAGRSAKFTLQAVTASLLQAVSSQDVSDEIRDDFWTMVTYFNSLRELGGALVLMQDDVIASLADYASRRGEEPRTLTEIMELTSRVSSSEIKEYLNQLDKKCTEDGACDSVLASNMISVGVDVSRLGIMVVNGQPKGIAEYIQATSRVGRRRGGPGGLVLSLYNNAKARDRSHFESFKTWHMALYKDVEATSLTPFAPRARQKALHAALVILSRHLIAGLNENPNSVVNYRDELESFIEEITERAEQIDPEEALNVQNSLELFLESWIANGPDLKNYWQDNFGGHNTSLMISAEKAAELKARKGGYYGRATPTPNSMRNVEPGTLFVLEERLRSD